MKIAIERHPKGLHQGVDSYSLTEDQLKDMTLAQFRLLLVKDDLILKDDQFIVAGTAVDTGQEATRLVKDAVTGDAIEVREKADAAPGTTVPLVIRRTPKGLGDGNDKTHRVNRVDLGTLTVAQLRTALEKKGYILAADTFTDQGIAVTAAAESTTLVTDIVAGENHVNVRNQAEVDAGTQGAAVSLIIKREPKGLGDGKDKTHKVTQGELDAMTLAGLRTALVGAGYMEADDKFTDQGVEVDPATEAARKVTSILTADKALGLRSKAEVDKAAWEKDAPKIDLSKYTPDLKPPAAPSHTPATDQTGQAPPGFGSIVAPDTARTFSELDEPTLRAILTDSRLYPTSTQSPACAALVVKNDVDFAAENIVQCKTIETLGSRFSRVDTIHFTYSEEMMKWNKQMVTDTSAGSTIPQIFGLQGSYRHETSRLKFRQHATACLTATIALPKLRVSLTGVSLTKTFVQAVKDAVASGHAPKLLDTLARSGQFIATDFYVGGKIICSTRKELSENYTAETLGREFKLAAQGSFEASGLPVTLAGGGGWKDITSEERRRLEQSFDLSVTTIGGFGESSGSEPTKLGANWMDTVLKFPRTWRVMGIDSAEPTLTYLEKGLEDDAKGMLRDYFQSKLILKHAGPAGKTIGKRWDDDLGGVKRVAGANIRQAKLVDGVQFVYDLSGGGQRTAPWRGKSVESEVQMRLAPGDEIVAVEVGWDDTIDHLIFWTRQGRRYPPGDGTRYGWTNAVQRMVFDQPRIQGFWGHEDHFVESVGVQYLDLDESLPPAQRSALLSLERYLYS